MTFETPRGHLPPLTSIRFFAAAAIVVFHMLGSWQLPTPEEMSWHFGIGVDLFFVLSGFILSYTYRSVDSLSHAFRMVAYRMARIWPLHMVLLFILLLANPYGLQPFLNGPIQVLASVFLVQAWVGDYAYTFSGNSVAWTLSVELFFYLLVPFLTKLKTRYLVLVTAVTTGLTVIWAQSLISYKPASEFGVVTASAILRTHPGMFFALFVVGMIAARIFVSRPWTLNRLQATALEVLTVALAVWFFLDNENLAPQIARLLHGSGAFGHWLTIISAALFFAPLIFVLAMGKGYVSKLLTYRPLVFLGEISFATYMCHMVLFLLIRQWDQNQFWHVTSYLGLTLIASAVLYKVVERPANRLLRGWINSVSRREVAG